MEPCCLSISNIAITPDTLTRLGGAGICEVLIQVMTAHMSNPGMIRFLALV
jgi:hypothetical protein